MMPRTATILGLYELLLFSGCVLDIKDVGGDGSAVADSSGSNSDSKNLLLLDPMAIAVNDNEVVGVHLNNDESTFEMRRFDVDGSLVEIRRSPEIPAPYYALEQDIALAEDGTIWVVGEWSATEPARDERYGLLMRMLPTD